MRCDDDCTHQSGYSPLAWIQTSDVEAAEPALSAVERVSRRIFSGTSAVERDTRTLKVCR